MGTDENKCWNFSLCKIFTAPELQRSRVLKVHMLDVMSLLTACIHYDLLVLFPLLSSFFAGFFPILRRGWMRCE